MTVYNAINQIRTESNQSQSVGANGKAAAKTDGSVCFSEYLADAMGVDGSQENTGSVAGCAPVSQLTKPESSSDPAVFAVNDLLGALEQYETALGDSSVSLKEMEPLVSSMEEQALKLSRESNSIGDGDLKDLVNSALTQATVESIKFRRGDYV